MAGGEHPLTSTRKVVSTVLQYTQYGLLGVGVFGDRVAAISNHPVYQRFRQNKMMFLIGGYMLINVIKGSVCSTGAFEVYLDSQMVFSKLNSGRMPRQH